ncbi:MAG: UbiA family prenyltransferase [Paracoccaceae bacterium]|nr:UbiA family prenyltransferase [Paracoccaceae bacterium]
MNTDETRGKPLVLDVDGTFLKTDLLFESFWAALGRKPIACLKAVLRNLGNRAALKRELAELSSLRVELLPVNEQVAQLARRSRRRGRKVVLASGSDRRLVQALAQEHGIAERVLASDGKTNLTGRRKAEALVRAFGERGFDYAGDSVVDLPVWEQAENAIIVGHLPKVARRLAAKGVNVEEIRQTWNARDLLRALRPHQWVKNILLFLPLIAAHQVHYAPMMIVFFAALAFSLAASTIYIVNDLLDLEADRLHPTKKNRPFAAGKVPIKGGMLMAVGLGIYSLVLAAIIGPMMLGVLALYMVLSLAYSLRLKRMRWIDIAMLAALYTLRVVAGAVAAHVPASGFLIAFIYPVFLTLGCVKRLTELTLAKGEARLPGRGYGRRDRGDLLNIAIIGMAGALLVFFLYSFSDMAAILYPSRWQLWLAMIPMGGWLFRMVLLGWKGKQDYDPIVFALRDKYGLALIALTLALMFSAASS